jgi:hypothetical protein
VLDWTFNLLNNFFTDENLTFWSVLSSLGSFLPTTPLSIAEMAHMRLFSRRGAAQIAIDLASTSSIHLSRSTSLDRSSEPGPASRVTVAARSMQAPLLLPQFGAQGNAGKGSRPGSS